LGGHFLCGLLVLKSSGLITRLSSLTIIGNILKILECILECVLEFFLKILECIFEFFLEIFKILNYIIFILFWSGFLNLTVDNLDIGGKDYGFINVLGNSGSNSIFVVKIERRNDTWE